ncbi:MAG: hypothetical protein M0005_01760 [Actinomycetota bacterium]|nr:hypothetical protein [Actinomycetota bacterium]
MARSERSGRARRARHRVRNTLLTAAFATGAVAGTVGAAGAAAAYPHQHYRSRHHRPAGNTTPTTTLFSATTTVSGALPSPAPPPSAPADSCVKAGWALAVQGAPGSFTPGADAAYLWYDANGGWALRFTHAAVQDKVIFAGSLQVASGQFTDVSAMTSQGHDIVALSGNKRTIYFRFVDFGLLDGLNFATHCTKAFTVNIHASGTLVPAGKVYLGSSSANPPSDPFKVARGTLLSAGIKQLTTKR